MRVLLAMGCVAALAGCEAPACNNNTNIRWETQSMYCVDAGGVPVRSSWDGELKTCEFPPLYTYKDQVRSTSTE